MAKILEIKKKYELPRYKVCFYLSSPVMAEQYSISFLFSVREQWGLLDLYAKGNILILQKGHYIITLHIRRQT